MKKGVTVLICTYNGAERLPKTLAYLSQQLISKDIGWEIILIDNASNDKTSSLAATEWEKYNLPGVGFTVMNEQRPGKINALETGTLLASYEFLIICDDDNWLSSDYIQRTYDILENDPSIGAVGGQSIAVNDSGVFPDWFDAFKTGYAVGKQGTKRGYVTPRGYLFGAGLGTRVKLYQQMYEHFPSLLVGREGEKLTAGEDAEYCQRLVLRGYELFYDPELTFQHYMPQKRLELEYRNALFAGLAESDKILDKYYLISRLKLKINKNPFNKLRLLMISPFRALFIFNLSRDIR